MCFGHASIIVETGLDGCPAAFLGGLALQQEAQRRQFKHEMRQQQMLQEFKEKQEQSCRKFEVEMK